jgi:hypothetical protein
MDPMTGKPVLVIRIGKGASGNMGGRLSPADAPVVVEYKLQTSPTAKGNIPTQSQTSAKTGGNPGLPTASFPSGNGMQPGAPTVVHVPDGNADLRVIVTKVSAESAAQCAGHLLSGRQERRHDDRPRSDQRQGDDSTGRHHRIGEAGSGLDLRSARSNRAVQSPHGAASGRDLARRGYRGPQPRCSDT